MSRWNQDAVRAGLRRVLEADDEWPSYAEFVRRGQKGLRDAVTRTGGARRWAGELGLSYRERRPGYAARWTEERIRQELAEFLGGRDAWPRRTEFETTGRKALRDAIGRSGGISRWATEFALPITDRRCGSRRAYGDDEIEHALRPLVVRLGRWPTKGEFRDEGLAPLLAALYRYRTVSEWQRRFGVRSSFSGVVPERTIWSDQRVDVELRRFCAGYDRWPGANEFRRRGHWKLYTAASRNGGIAWWRQRLGL